MKRKTAFVFPGQGSQYVGMGKDFLENEPDTGHVFDVAESITGVPVQDLCINGPIKELIRTSNLQPCLTAVDIVCFLAASRNGLEADAVAGHSLGEFPALFAAGVVSLEDVFRLVSERGRLMDEVGCNVPGGMAAVIGMNMEKLKALLSVVASGGVLTLANHNSPEQIIITGEKSLVNALCREVKNEGARAIPLKVAGAFHSPLMKKASERFSRVLAETEFKEARLPVYCNVSASPETDPQNLKNMVTEQMCAPVRWYEIIVSMYSHGISAYVELGPKKVLGSLIKKCLPGEDVIVAQIEDRETLKSTSKSCSSAL
ncbi:MAG TPA: ACP S-malonyltransferase [Thermodesulfobacteriaceae bacterium]|nr:ACP S-malonyltransferase [Thermodesulfobacteriaceae bacterium]